MNYYSKFPNQHLHFSGSILLAPYLIYFLQCEMCSKFGAILDKFALNLAKKLMQKQHILLVLFGTNLVSNISTKAL